MQEFGVVVFSPAATLPSVYIFFYIHSFIFYQFSVKRLELWTSSGAELQPGYCHLFRDSIIHTQIQTYGQVRGNT